MSDPIGQTFGDYRIEALLGSGAAGRVYAARHVRLDRPVALRLLLANLSANPGFRAAFLPEMRSAASLKHEAIADVFDFGDQAGSYYGIEELLPGGSLRALLQQRAGQAWELAIAVNLARQAADGLAYAHARGIAHGDVRPENMLFTEANLPPGAIPTLKLTDFGIARLLEAAGQPSGAPAYLSPEQCLGAVADARSDIYALGVVLYEITVGYQPFVVSSRAEATEKHTRTQPAAPRTIRPQLPAELEAITLRCLAKQPEERPTAAELSLALQAILRDLSPAQTILLAGTPTERMPTPPAAVLGATVAAPSLGAPRIRVLDASGATIQTLELPAGGLIVGRDTTAGLRLDDEKISRQHFRLDWDGKRLTVTDLGSTNGTMLNGMRIPAKAPQAVPIGTTLAAGPFRLRFDWPATPSAPTIAATDPLLATLLTDSSKGATPPGVPAAQATGATQAATAGQFVIRIEPERLALTPGQAATASVILLNQTNAAEYVSISIEGAPARWVRGPESPVQVNPGVPVTVPLTISVPRETENAATDYPVIVRARSIANQAQSWTTRGRWTVDAFRAGRLELVPQRARGSGYASYQVELSNDGNQTNTYELHGADPAQALSFNFARQEVTLGPGESRSIGLTVETQRRWFGGDQTHEFEVFADSDGAPPHSTGGQFINAAAMPSWVPALLAALLLLLALAAFLGLIGNGGSGSGGVPTAQPGTTGTPTITALPTETLAPTATPTPEPGAPQIVTFDVLPDVASPGQAVNVVWDVRDAQRVVIEQFGDVAPQGQRQFRTNQTTDFTLTAYNGDKTTTQVRRLFITTPTAQPTAIPPTAVPPTAVPPTAVPPTAVPPTGVPPTVVPPTAVPPTAVPPTEVVPTVIPPINLLDMAPAANWSTSNGPITFGTPRPGTEDKGYAQFASNVALEDGRTYPRTLYTVPLSATNGYISGEYNIPTIQAGQHFLAEVGFGANVFADPIVVTVSFEGQELFKATKRPDGTILPIDIDLASLDGRSGRLTLTTAFESDPAQVGLYWINPQIAGN